MAQPQSNPLSDMDSVWVSLPKPDTPDSESMADRVRRVNADLVDLNTFYSISISSTRHKRLLKYYDDERESLFDVDFDGLKQQDRVDFLLLRDFLRRSSHQLQDEVTAAKEMSSVLPFAQDIIDLCESRERVEKVDSRQVARSLDTILNKIVRIQEEVLDDKVKVSQIVAYKATKALKDLHDHLSEFFSFYSSYDPLFDWWVTKPFQEADRALRDYQPVLQQKLAGMHGDGKDDIIGEPIGREALLVELEAEMLAYSPEELIGIANDQFKWCEVQMKEASNELGFGDDWRKAMEYVKEQSVPPGEYNQIVKGLAQQGAEYVRKHDLLTVPKIAEETYRTLMMGAEQQKVSPFFLGGPVIMVAYPTADMPYETKEMVMRGNNKHFAKATAFHELIPGHRLHIFNLMRHQTHRMMFMTAFAVEGWGLYWEMMFWQRSDFFSSPEDRIGTMFWRMHRCARIILSLKFHLGQMQPQECIDMLVNWVGHERSTAEGEVRRWLNGDYAPLYQTGYMIGALQVVELRKEALKSGKYTEKAFNDAFMRMGPIPIELMRAVILGEEVTADYKPKWRFY